MMRLNQLLSIAGLCMAIPLAAHAAAPTVTYIYTDPQGTPLAETDAEGNVTATFDYRPYGAQALGTPPQGPGYTGHVNDADTGLVYMQARYYDPLAGRFLSVDPVSPEPGDEFGFNRFVYGNNNTYRFRDPDGRSACDHCNDVSGASAFVGRQAISSSVERQRYNKETAKLSPGDSAGRSALKSDSRARTPSMTRAAIEAVRPSTAAASDSGGRANVSNTKVNLTGEALSTAGKSLIVVSTAMAAYNVSTSAEPTRALAGAGGATIGGLVGGEGGAWAGAGVGLLVGGPVGAAVGAVVGGLGGSAVGAHYGSQAAESVYDKTRED